MEEFLESCKDIAFRRATASELINPEPALVFSVSLVASGGGTATAIIRNGHNASGDPVVDLSAPQNSSDSRFFRPPIYFDKGIFADLGLNVLSILIRFRQTGDPKTPTEKHALKSFLPSWSGRSEEERKNA